MFYDGSVRTHNKIIANTGAEEILMKLLRSLSFSRLTETDLQNKEKCKVFSVKEDSRKLVLDR